MACRWSEAGPTSRCERYRPRIMWGVGVLLIAVHTSTASYGAEPGTRPKYTQTPQYVETFWTEHDGLPSNNILALEQTLDGYLWVGTRGGLVRFDGVRFNHWELEPFGVEVTALCAARDGSLWIGFGGSGGVSRLRNGHIDKYSPGDGFLNGPVVRMAEAGDDTIWAIVRNGVSRFRNGRWERVGTQYGLSSQVSFLGLYIDHAGNVWLGSSAGVLVLKAGAERFELSSSPFRRVLAFTEDSAGTIWVTDYGNAFRPLDEARSPSLLPPGLSSAVNGSRIIRDGRGNLWVGTLGSGLLLVPRSNSGVFLPVESLTVWRGLSSVVWSLLQDREGNIWVGTEDGLARISESSIVSLSRYDGRRLSFVRALTVERDGSVWVATANGLAKVTGTGQHWYGPQDGLPDWNVTAVHVDEKGNLWAATPQNLARYTRGRFVPVPLRGGVRLNWIRGLTTDRRGGLWLWDLDHGLFHWKDGRLEPFGPIPESRRSLVASALADRNGRLWIGFTDGGIAVQADRKVQFYSERNGLARGRLETIFEDGRGVIWIGTSTGLSRFTGRGFETVYLKDHFPGSAVTAIVDDEDGYLWLALSSGIVRLAAAEFAKAARDPAHRIPYRIFDAAEGLSGSRTRLGSPAASRTSDGTLWFATSSGLAILNPRWLSEDRPPPPVRIEAIVADDRNFSPTPKLRLPPRVSRLQINYTGVTLTVPGKIRFRYILEGFDHDWVNAGPSRSALYTNLPPGTYRFRVAASNNYGVWTTAGEVLDFSVQPTFYQTRWFFGACLTAAAILLWLAWQFRLRQMRQQFALVLAERSRVARSIHDTLLQSLVGLALQFDTMASQIDSSPNSVKDQLRRIRSHVERYIREAQQSIWNLRSPTLERLDLPTALREAGESIVCGKSVRFEFSVNGNPVRCAPRVEEELFRIGQEAVTNAVRHAEARVLHMELSYQDDTVYLRVSDDGRGFDPEDAVRRARGNWGLMFMQERALQIGAQLRLVSRVGGGTRLETVAPLSLPKFEGKSNA